MDETIINFIICPNCGSSILSVKEFSKANNELHEGMVTCNSCEIWYKIDHGVLDLLPLALRRHDLYEKFAKKFNIHLNKVDVANVNLQKKEQILFFKKDFSSYENDIVNSSYYKALDKLTFEKWFYNNSDKIIDPILEVGCGTGRQSIKIANTHKYAICIDISEEMVLLAKLKIDQTAVPNNLNFIIGDAEDPPVKNNMFGACVICATLHHLSSPENAIRNLSHKLKNGGLFYSIDPHDSYVRFIFDYLMKIWKLYDEEASESPLIKEKILKKWLSDAKIQSKVTYSTYLPPHIFLILMEKPSLTLLKRTDDFFNKIPLFFKFSGIISSEGIKIE
jgi:ubiquinone/menaquinone biosynthesis C-methylase UbiE/uncharacterized protein YbaR (Trm112 family)